MGTTQEEIDKAEKQGFDTGLTVTHPLDDTWQITGLCGQFHSYGLWHRRYFWLSGP